MPPKGALDASGCGVWRGPEKGPLGIPAQGTLARAREKASSRKQCLLLAETTSLLRVPSRESNRGASAFHHCLRSPLIRKELLRLEQFCVYASV